MNNKSGQLFERLSVIIGATLLTFLLGSWVTENNLYPYDPYLQRAFFALKAHLGSYGDVNPRTSAFWSQTAKRADSVTTSNSAKSYGEYTFYCSRHANKAFAIDADGKVVHTWSKRIKNVWPNSNHLKGAELDDIVWDGCEFLDNGHILAVFKAPMAFPGNYGLVELDAHSNIQWSYKGAVHHDTEVVGDDFWVLTRKAIETPEELDDQPRLGTQILESHVVKLSDNGEELKKISVYDALIRSKYRGIINSWRALNRSFDPLHANNLEIISPNFARAHPALDAGDILVSLRNISGLVAIDPAAEKVVWAARGAWIRQHDPDLRPNGRILLFDNLGNYKGYGRSRLLSFHVKDHQHEVTYEGAESTPFESKIMGEQQYLPNGNILITSSKRGRIFEINPGGDIVWEFFNPARKMWNGKEYIATIGFGVERLSAKDLPEPLQ